MDASRVVLVTGCSSGIGEATATHLAARGHTVVATARRAGDLAALAAAGCVTLPLDVTDEASMTAAVREIEARVGPVDVLVNNAGYSQSGAVESVPIARVRAQFETNVFGLLRLTQLVLPGMRQRRRGRIVNVSSMGGRFTFPGGGRRRLPRQQARPGGAERRAPLRAAAVRRPGGGDPAGADPHPLRRHRAGPPRGAGGWRGPGWRARR
jgi:NAD(P)-dependent dehydrogenase (short-subunit alcohol dehydrogenase family)